MNIGTIRAMEEHGGSFVKSLATCWRMADPDNKQRLESAFPHLFGHYFAMFVEKDDTHESEYRDEAREAKRRAQDAREGIHNLECADNGQN